MNSFVPTNIATKKEKIITEEFLNSPQSFNWNIDDEPLSEFNCQLLASMAFPIQPIELCFLTLQIIQLSHLQQNLSI